MTERPATSTITRRPARPGSVRAALGYRSFRLLWMGAFASNIGTWMQNVVLPAYVYGRTGKASIVGLLVFAQLGPLLLLSIPAGVAADRFDRRHWLMTMQAVQMGFSALLAPLAAFDAPIWTLFLAQLGVGVGNALNAPAYSAALPSLVGSQDLPGAISLNSFQINGSRVIGPIIAAFLGLLGMTTSQFFLVNAMTYLFVVGALAMIHLPPVVQHHRERGWRQLTSGLRIAAQRPVVRRILVTLTTFSLLSLPYVGLFPAVARLNFGIEGSSATYKWLYATWGLGAALGGLAIGTVFVGWDKRTLIRVFFAVFAVFLALFAVIRIPWPAFPVGFCLGLSYFGSTTSLLTVLQSRLEDAVRGRVMSLWFMAFGGTVPIGNLIFGPVMDAVGARWVLLVGAGWAAFLAWWCNIARIERRSGVDGPAPGEVPAPG